METRKLHILNLFGGLKYALFCRHKNDCWMKLECFHKTTSHFLILILERMKCVLSWRLCICKYGFCCKLCLNVLETKWRLSVMTSNHNLSLLQNIFLWIEELTIWFRNYAEVHCLLPTLIHFIIYLNFQNFVGTNRASYSLNISPNPQTFIRVNAGIFDVCDK